jgi:hypothetical protein
MIEIRVVKKDICDCANLGNAGKMPVGYTEVTLGFKIHEHKIPSIFIYITVCDMFFSLHRWLLK